MCSWNLVYILQDFLSLNLETARVELYWSRFLNLNIRGNVCRGNKFVKTCVSSNLRQVKSNNRCMGCPNFNFSARWKLRSKDIKFRQNWGDLIGQSCHLLLRAGIILRYILLINLKFLRYLGKKSLLLVPVAFWLRAQVALS